MASVKNGKIAQQHVAAILQRDGFVAHAGMLGDRARAPSAAEAFAPDQAGADDGNILKTLAPDQAVVPMIVAEVLDSFPTGRWIRRNRRRTRWACGVGSKIGGRIRGEDGCAGLEMQRDVALEVDGITKVSSGGEADGSASGRCGGFDGFVDRWGVERVAVAFGAEGGDFVGSFLGGGLSLTGGDCGEGD